MTKARHLWDSAFSRTIAVFLPAHSHMNFWPTDLSVWEKEGSQISLIKKHIVVIITVLQSREKTIRPLCKTPHADGASLSITLKSRGLTPAPFIPC